MILVRVMASTPWERVHIKNTTYIIPLLATQVPSVEMTITAQNIKAKPSITSQQAEFVEHNSRTDYVQLIEHNPPISPRLLLYPTKKHK